MLKRQTSSPELDFIVVPINERTVGMLKRQLSARGVMGKDGVVIHTQIQASDEMIFSACDNFHKDCTVTSKSVPEDFLASLKSHGLLRSYGDV